MKKAKVLTYVLILVLSALALSCTTLADFEKVTLGHSLSTPIEMDQLANSIRLSLTQYNWIIQEEYPGRITARYSKSDGLIMADIEVRYNSMGYEIEYVDSRNLDADLARMRIHPNFVRWIANLNKTIYQNYLLIN